MASVGLIALDTGPGKGVKVGAKALEHLGGGALVRAAENASSSIGAELAARVAWVAENPSIKNATLLMTAHGNELKRWATSADAPAPVKDGAFAEALISSGDKGLAELGTHFKAEIAAGRFPGAHELKAVTNRVQQVVAGCPAGQVPESLTKLQASVTAMQSHVQALEAANGAVAGQTNQVRDKARLGEASGLAHTDSLSITDVTKLTQHRDMLKATSQRLHEQLEQLPQTHPKLPNSKEAEGAVQTLQSQLKATLAEVDTKLGTVEHQLGSAVRKQEAAVAAKEAERAQAAKALEAQREAAAKLAAKKATVDAAVAAAKSPAELLTFQVKDRTRLLRPDHLYPNEQAAKAAVANAEVAVDGALTNLKSRVADAVAKAPAESREAVQEALNQVIKKAEAEVSLFHTDAVSSARQRLGMPPTPRAPAMPTARTATTLGSGAPLSIRYEVQRPAGRVTFSGAQVPTVPLRSTIATAIRDARAELVNGTPKDVRDRVAAKIQDARLSPNEKALLREELQRTSL